MNEDAKLPPKRLLTITIGVLRVSLFLVVGLFFIFYGSDYFEPAWNYIIGALILIYGIYRIFRLLKSNREE
jgi:hypothetical protein